MSKIYLKKVKMYSQNVRAQYQRSSRETKLNERRFYDNVKINDESTIAYKGGHIERDLLKELCIPAVNLEVYGCPKAEFLFDKLIWLETCPNHIATHAYQHCPKVEVEAFAAWLEETKL